jgi:hypothetical protein
MSTVAADKPKYTGERHFISTVVFWVVTPCGIVGGYEHSNETVVTTGKTTRCHTLDYHNRYFYRRESQVSEMLRDDTSYSNLQILSVTLCR